MLDLLNEAQTHQRLRIDQIEMNGGTQMRSGLNAETCGDYRDKMLAGAQFPPVIVYYDGECYWLADGFHRVNAYKQAFATTGQPGPIAAEVRSGTRRDAVLYAVGANDDHGLRRTREDRRIALRQMLNDNEWGQWSNREIARHCRVDEKTVRTMRIELTAENPQLATDERKYTDRHGNTQTMQTAKIGRAVPYSPPTDPTPPATNGHRAPATITQQRPPVYISPEPALQPTADMRTVAQVRDELAGEITALVGRLESALADVATAGRLVEDRALVERTDGHIHALIGKLKALKARGL
jgi:hypothetical protein